MTVKKNLGTLIAATAVAAFVSTSAMAGVTGKYKRPNGKTAVVKTCPGGIKASSAGTTMFCAKKSGSKWKSNHMKHPEFPGTYYGTVTRTKSGLRVQGCITATFGCMGENWTKIKKKH